MTETVVANLVAASAEAPDRPVILEKRLGRWHTRTAKDLTDAALGLATGLRELGIGPGDTVAAMLDNHLEAVALDLAIMACGATALQVPPRIHLEDLRAVVREARPRVVIVQGQHEADDVLSLIDSGDADGLERLIFADPAGVSEYSADVLAPLTEILGDPAAAPDPSQIDVDGPAAAIVDYTTEPRLIVHSHRALLAGAHATITAFSLTGDDRIVITRPLGDAPERTLTVYPALLAGARLAFPESRATIAAALKEVAPTYLHASSRFLTSLASDLVVRFSEARGSKSLVRRWWERRTGAHLLSYGSEQSPGALARLLIGVPALHKVGLDQIRVLAASGDPLSSEPLGFLRSLGMDIREVTLDVAVAGPLLIGGAPQTECSVGDDGIVVVSGPVAAGGDGEHTPTTLVAAKDDGLVAVLGRVGTAVPSTDGAWIPAGVVERKLLASPLIAGAVARHVDGTVDVAIELARGPASRWAQRERFEATTYASLTRIPGLAALITGLVEDAVDDGVPVRVHLSPTPWSNVQGALGPGGSPHRERVMEYCTSSTNTVLGGA